MPGTTVIDELRAAVAGQVLTPDDDGYADAVASYNPVAAHEPDVVVVAAAAADLASAVGIAARHGLPVQVQNTGHGPSVRTRGGVLLRTTALKDIDVDTAAGTVRVGPGVAWGELLTACSEHGVLPLGMGSVASVGVTGYTLGGGLGPLARQQGLAADHVVALEVVDAGGQLNRVDADHQPELFWALRGGRLGLGVVASLTLRTVAEPAFYAARLVYPRPLVADALPAYAQWREQLGEQTSGLATLMRFPDNDMVPPPLRGQRYLQVDVFHLGDGADGVRAAVDQLAADQPPGSRDDYTGTPAAWLAAQPAPPSAPSWQSSFVLDGLDADVAREIVAAAGPETEAPWSVLELRVMGGAAAADPAEPNAAGRWSGLLVNVVAAGDPAGFAALPDARDEFKGRFGDRAKDGTAINFLGIARDYDALTAAWPADTAERLRAARSRHDPERIFSPAPV